MSREQKLQWNRLIAGVLISLACRVGYADTKISAMSSTSTLNSGDIIPVVTNPSGSAGNFSITKTNLSSTLDILTQSSATANFANRAKVATDTTTIASNLSTESSNVASATNTLTTNLNTEITNRANGDAAVATDTTTLYANTVHLTSTLQSGATFFVSSGTVNNLNLTTLQGVTPGLVPGTNITSITGAWPNQTINAATQSGGGGGSSSLQVTQSGVEISSPTSSINFLGPPFIVTQVNTSTSQVKLDGSSVTLQGVVTAGSLGALTTSSATATYLNVAQGLTQSSATATYLNVAQGLTQSSATATYVNVAQGLTQSSATATYLQNSSVTITYLNVAQGLTQSSATATYLQLSSATATYLQGSSATVTYLNVNQGLTQSSATATYLQSSSATATYLQNSSATLTYLNVNQGLTQSSATATYLQNSSATATYFNKANVLAATNFPSLTGAVTTAAGSLATVYAGAIGTQVLPSTIAYTTSTQTYSGAPTFASPSGINVTFGVVASSAVLSSAAVNGQLTVSTLQGASLATCGDASHGLSWTGGSFGCQSITGTAGGVVASASPTWTGVHNWANTQRSTFTVAPAVLNLTNTILATDASGVIISTTVSASGGLSAPLAFPMTYQAAICISSTSSLGFNAISSSAPVTECNISSITVFGTAGFVDGSTNAVQGSFWLPDDWTGNIDFYWIWQSSGTTGNAAWQLRTGCQTSGETAIGWNVFTSSVTATPAIANTDQKNKITSPDVSSCTAGDMFTFEFVRSGTIATDTLTPYARLKDVIVVYRRNMTL